MLDLIERSKLNGVLSPYHQGTQAQLHRKTQIFLKCKLKTLFLLSNKVIKDINKCY